LSGEIPPELGNLANLSHIYLAANHVRGCAPTAWRNVRFNDLGDLGLPFCDMPQDGA